VMMGVIWLGSGQIATIFGTDPELIRELTQYLLIMPVGYALYGVLSISEETLNAVGRPLMATGQTVIHMFVLYAPLALVGTWLAQMQGLLWGVAVGNILGGMVAYGLSRLSARPRRARPVSSNSRDRDAGGSICHW